MTQSWTGGQYSIYRMLFGSYLLLHFTRWLPSAAEVFSNNGGLARASDSPLYPFFPNLLFVWETPAAVTLLLVTSVLASIALAIGSRDRIAALVLFYCWACLFTRNPLIEKSVPLFFGWLLLAHAMLPEQPFGSWDARGRIDPDAGWRMPNPVYTSTWIILVVGYLGVGLTTQITFAEISTGLIFLHLFTFNPGWISPRLPADGGKTLVFYDGACGLCHHTIRVLLAEDTNGLRFRFAPLDSNLFRSAHANPISGFRTGDSIPDSVLVQRPGEHMLSRAEGILEIGQQLGGLWRILAIIGSWLPISLLNAVYEYIARNRHHLFTRPDTACPIIPIHLRDRFGS